MVLCLERVKATARQNQSQSERKKEQSQQQKDLAMADQPLDPTIPVAPLDGSEPRV